MIESLHISGFKLFRDITLPRLGRLNLFVGENNSGKSCLLEAINLYAGRDPVLDILETVLGRPASREMPWVATVLGEGVSLAHPAFDLFHRVGHRIARHIVIEVVGDSRPFRVDFRLHRTSTNAEGLRCYVPIVQGEAGSERGEVGLPVYRGDKPAGLITRRLVPLPEPALAGEGVSNGDGASVAFLPAAGFSDESAASMWDAIVQGPGQDLVLDWLRLLDPRIEDLAYIGKSDSRVALLKVQGQGRLPLRSMGDGLTKLFYIALAAASAPQGALLIDEFENGLHWSVQEKLWRALAKAARDFNVQVFATTHSRDCIEAFAAAAEDAGPDGATIYRLERKGDDVIATDLPLLNVDAAMREHVEVR